MSPNRTFKLFNVIHFHVVFLMIHVFKNEVIMIQKGHQRIIIYVIFLN